MPFNVKQDVPAPSANQGTDPSRSSENGFWRKHRKPRGPRPTKEAVEEGLGAIVGMVRGGNAGGRDPSGSFHQRVASGGTRAGLQISPRLKGNQGPLERDFMLARVRLGEVELGAGFLPKPMVDAVGVDLKSPLSASKAKNIQKSHRIRTAAHCDKDSVVFLNERFLSDELPGECEERRGVRPHRRLGRRGFELSQLLERDHAVSAVTLGSVEAPVGKLYEGLCAFDFACMIQ